MKINELRIGNIVRIDSDRAVVNRIESNGIGFDRNDDFGPDYIKIEKVEGVPITNQWLLSVGFEKTHKDLYQIKSEKNIIYLTCMSIGYIVSLTDPYYEEIIKIGHILHLHQLQNLYFTLRGEELIKTK